LSKLRVGIIGCGNIFKMHAVSIQLTGLAEVVAVCDVKEDRVQLAAKAYNCVGYTDYHEMIEKASLDVIHICTPHYLHAPMTIAAANAGKHVLTEKPMSITVADAEAMIEASERNNVQLGVIFQNRYNPGSVLIKEELTSGRLGRILGAKCSVTWKRTDEYYSNSDWKGTWAMEGGGVVIDQAIHTLDLVRWFVNEDIEYVDAAISNRAHEIIEVEDSAEGVVKFKSGIVMGFYTTNYYSYDAPVEVEIHCEHGIAKLISDLGTVRYHNGDVVVRDIDPNEVVDFGEGVKQYWGVSHVKQVTDYYKDLIAGRATVIDGREALRTQRMVAAIYESGKENKRVFL
jgi:UDP-N-acetyl-2-amino-2-deoxyglucuronate dehydrogenase